MDLMIGDWVNVIPFHNKKNSYFKRVENGNDIDLLFDFQGHVEPISITPEILEKNGFKKYSKDVFKINFKGKSKCIEFFFNDDLVSMIIINHKIDNLHIRTTFETSCAIVKKEIYVHELQQTLRLCRIDKEIKL